MLQTIKTILIILAIVVALILIIRRIYKSYPRKTLALYKGISRVYVHSFSPKPRVFVDLNTGEITRTGYTGPDTSDYRYSEEYELPNGKKSFSTGHYETKKCEEYGYLTYNLEGKHVFKRDDSVKQAFEEACEVSREHFRKTEKIISWIAYLSHVFLPLLGILSTYIISHLLSIEALKITYGFVTIILQIFLSIIAIGLYGEIDFGFGVEEASKWTLLFCWIGFAAVSIPVLIWRSANFEAIDAYTLTKGMLLFFISGIKAIVVTIAIISKLISTWSKKVKEEMWNK